MSTKRRSGARIATNPGGAPDFFAVWPDVRRVLLRNLRRHVDRDTAEDICQDVAERLLARRVPFDSVDDLVKWAQRVASNRAIDTWRTHTRRVSPEPVPDRESPLDVARLVTHRAAIDEAAAAIRSLRPDERDALLRADSPDVTDSRDARERQRDANLRERARERLRGLVHNFPAGIGTRVGNWLRGRRSPAGNAAAADWGHLLAGAGIAIAMLAGPGGDGADAPVPRPTARNSIAAGTPGGDAAAQAGTGSGGAGFDRAGRPGATTQGAPGARSAGTADRVVLQELETPVSRTTVGSGQRDPENPQQEVLCVGGSGGSRFCAEDALAGLPLPL